MTHSPALTLLSCPHCGGPARFGACAVEEADESGAEYIECEVCSASTALVFPCMDSAKENLVERWNRRAELAASADAGKLVELQRELDATYATMESFADILDRAWKQIPGAYEPDKSDDLAECIAELAALSRPAPATTAPVSAQGDEEGDRKAAYEAMARTVNPNAAISAHGLFYAGWQARAQVAQGDEVDAARYRWLLDGERTRQGEVLPDTGTRLISKNETQALMSFNYWCSRDELNAAVDATRAQQGSHE